MIKYKRLLTILLFALFLALTFLIIGRALQDNSAEDSSAILGGRLEEGYPSAGFLVAFYGDNKVKNCSGVAIADDVFLSAAHCIPPESLVSVGLGQYELDQDKISLASEAIVHPDYDETTSENDLSITKLSTNLNNLFGTAEISSPRTGCDYIVVGYGLSEDNLENPNDNTKLRKSADVCIQGFDEEKISIIGDGGGFCFGDSGSPIFRRNTNELIGIVYAISVDRASSGSSCSIGNSAFAVRLDTRVSQINSYILDDSTQADRTYCGSSCNRGRCEGNLFCSNNTCVIPGETQCIADDGEFCSTNSNILCGTGKSCVNNKCSEIEISQISDNFAENEITSLSFFDLGALDNMETLIAIISVGILIIGLLLIFLNIKSK